MSCCMFFSWQPIIDYIDAKYEEYLNAESRVIRKTHINDNRVHCCLYFITPTGHRFVVSIVFDRNIDFFLFVVFKH
jgi:septin family protein